MLGMVEVRLDGRAHLLDQALELGVLRARDQYLVDRDEQEGERLLAVHGVSLVGESRASTLATTRSQRSPAKLKASSQATSIFCASASRSRLRARKSRVRTVAAGISSTAAVSSAESSSTARSMKTVR